MADTATLEAALEAIATRLASQLAVPVQRGRRSGIGATESLPRLVVRMGNVSETPGEHFQTVLYRCEAAIEGYAAAPLGANDPDAALEAALADLHARCVAALSGVELAVGIAGDTIQPFGASMQPETPLIEVSAESVGGFTWTVEFEFLGAFGAGPYTTTS
jgi:hypothetical protein